MILTERLAPDRERLSVHRLGAGKVSSGSEHRREVVEARAHVRMLGTEDLATNPNRFAVEWLGFGKVASIVEQGCEVVEARRHVRVFGAEQPSACLQRLSQIRLGLSIEAEGLIG